MDKKIVAIGGGDNGRINSKGVKKPYETKEIDEEIVRLSGKSNPNLLFLAHSQILNGIEAEEGYYKVMSNIYSNLGCNVRWLKISDLKEDFNKVIEYVNWADIIYEGGGATEAMVNYWKETVFDKLLKQAYESGKVMCGVSAGAICWFNSGFTDDPKFLGQEENRIYTLDIIDAYYVPHINLPGKIDRVRTSLKYVDKTGILVSNCAAIEIVNDSYRILKSTPDDKSFTPYAIKAYYKDGKLFEEELNNTEFKNLNELLERSNSHAKI